MYHSDNMYQEPSISCRLPYLILLSSQDILQSAKQLEAKKKKTSQSFSIQHKNNAQEHQKENQKLQVKRAKKKKRQKKNW